MINCTIFLTNLISIHCFS